MALHITQSKNQVITVISCVLPNQPSVVFLTLSSLIHLIPQKLG